MRHVLFTVACMIAWLAFDGEAALAQGQPPDLTVTFHDVTGAPVAGVTVIVRDANGAHELVQATTDGQGVATFFGLPDNQVLIVIAGTLLNGTKLYQPGNDAHGIALVLDPPPTMLKLRSETDGMVVPDPATMTALEPGVPVATTVAVVATAPITTRLSVAQASPPLSVSAPGSAAAPIVATGDTLADSGGGQVWLGIGVVVVLVGAAALIAVVQRRAA